MAVLYSMFATELNLHYSANSEGGRQPFVFYNDMCAVHNYVIAGDLELSIRSPEFFPVAFIVILQSATVPNDAALLCHMIPLAQ